MKESRQYQQRLKALWPPGEKPKKLPKPKKSKKPKTV